MNTGQILVFVVMTILPMMALSINFLFLNTRMFGLNIVIYLEEKVWSE